MDDELTGYIHNINKKSAKTSWFDMQIQTQTEVVRGVCFSAAKHNSFKTFSDQKSPIKIKKFNIDTTANTKSVLMSFRIQLEPLAKLDFEPIEIPTTVSVPSIASVNPGQLVGVNANLLYLSGEKRLVPFPESFLISKSAAEILGIAQFSAYHSCQACKKKLHDENTNILKCGNCGLKQKLAKCTKNIYPQVLVKIDDNTNLTLTVFDQTIKNLLIVVGKGDMPQTEENVTEVFLDLPSVEIDYNKKTKIVTDIVPKA